MFLSTCSESRIILHSGVHQVGHAVIDHLHVNLTRGVGIVSENVHDTTAFVFFSA